jgi:ribosomal protein S18 acetylase RimI-like enzyme
MPAEAPARFTRVRRAVTEDEDALVVLEQRAFRGDRLSRAQFRRHLDSDSALVLVCTEQGRLLGDAVLFFRRGTRVARLYSLVTAPESRGRGVARALLAAAEQQARRRGDELRLEVRVDNRAAIALYEGTGYLRFASRRAYYEDGADAWRYRKLLR